MYTCSVFSSPYYQGAKLIMIDFNSLASVGFYVKCIINVTTFVANIFETSFKFLYDNVTLLANNE